MTNKPNVVYLLADQIRACSLPVYGDTQIETPNIDRLAQEGTVFSNAIATAPSAPRTAPCYSPDGIHRQPDTSSTSSKPDTMKSGLGDVFNRNGYRTAWGRQMAPPHRFVPGNRRPDYVPEGRDRLGFQHWRGYNFHTDYFNGTVNLDKGWRNERWDGYETDALNRYAFQLWMT